MSNEIDMGCEQEQRDRELCIAVARRQSERLEIPANGSCHNCLSPIAAGERYCDGECAKDHAARRAAEKRRGRPQ